MAQVFTPLRFLTKNKFIGNINFPKVLLVILVILLAYGQTLLMYFWQDDSALIFKLMNPEGRAGSFGYGIIGSGAYKYLVTPFVPFFPIFGKEPFGYFLVGLVTYGLATWAFYFFAKSLFESEKPAYMSTLLFSAGYVGSDTMFRVINSWQTNAGLVLALLTLGIYTRYLKTNKFKQYLLSVFSFWLTVELVFIRSHSLILSIVFLDLVFKLLPFSKRRIPGFIFRIIPFSAVFYKYYMTDASFGAPGANSVLRTVLSGDFVSLSPYFANFGNVLVPNVVQTRFISFLTKYFFSREPLDGQIVWFGLIILFVGLLSVLVIKRIYRLSKKSSVVFSMILVSSFFANILFFEAKPIWYRNIQTVFSGGLGMSVSVVILYLAYGLWRKSKDISRAILVGLLVAGTQFFGYFVQYPTAIIATHHRYYSHSIIGTAVLFGAIAYLWAKNNSKSKLLSFLPFALVIGTYLVLGVSYQRNLVLDRGRPSRQFYKDLLSFVPEIEKGSAFYFDVANRSRVGTQFGDFFSVGSMPESTALAMYYDMDRYEVFYITDFDELLFKIGSGEVDINKVYTFYVSGYNFRDFDSPEGLVDTTDEFRKLIAFDLGDKSISQEKYLVDTSYFAGEDFSTSKEEAIEIETDVTSIVPQLVTFNAKLSPQKAPDKLPYFSGYKIDLDTNEVVNALEYLSARNKYYKESKIQSTSDWKFREIEYIKDNNAQTTWQGHRIWWDENEVEDVTIDLGSKRLVSKLVWINWKTVLAPVAYDIQTSLDATNWKTVKSVKAGPERKNSEVVVEEFEPVNARFVRMHITGTQTNDSPGILEIEVVDAAFADVDTSQVQVLIDNPYSRISTEDEWNTITNEFVSLATANVSWKTNDTDAQTGEQRIPVFLDGRDHSYEFVVPASGTKLESIGITFSYPISGEISNLKYAKLTLDQLKSRGLIKDFKEN